MDECIGNKKMEKKIKVCFILGGLCGGGIGRVSSIIMNELANISDFEMHALLYEIPAKPEIYELNPKITKDYILENHANMANAILKEHAISKVANYLKKNKIDITIACGDLFYIVTMVAAKIAKTKVLCWDHTSMYAVTDQRFQRFIRKFGFWFSDFYLVLTRESFDYYKKKRKQKALYQIYNPIENKAIKSPQYNIESKKIISVGRITYQKNFPRLLEIAHAVFQKHPDWTWDIYGSGDLDKLKQRVHELSLENNVFFKGQVNNLYERYQDYSIMVMTSRYEGFPMTLLEGAANRLPLISFDIHTGPNEIIQNGINGFLCASSSDKEIVDRICELIENPLLRRNMSRESFETTKQFNIDTIVAQWDKLLKMINDEDV
jgi:glycosyltransferase involved in cell wall biosynthesis